ncbi:MAG: hypothetical protein IJG63_00555, partial [Oscillospiraceae bacterium]|nr:hypothetical protein [Oscillospiraceae bacterium]
MKRIGTFFCGVLCAVLVMMLAVPSFAASVTKAIEITTGIAVYVNNEYVEPKDVNGNPVDVFVYKGTTYLPIRAVANALGLPVDYDAKTHTALIGESDKIDYSTELFSQLAGKDFYFSSGVGGWSTELQIKADGSFTGSFHDADMGTTGEGYPNGTMYVCNFSGQFSDAAKLSRNEFSMQLKSITTEKSKDETWIEDGVRYVASDPYGFDNGKEFRVYMPGIRTADLPEEFVQWVASPRAWGSDIPETLPITGIYNVAGQMGFGDGGENDQTEPIDQTDYSAELFSQLAGKEFYFSSGAGGWSTDVQIKDDGSFSGSFHDSDMGDTGEGYPNGTMYVCSFSGRFSDVVKLSDSEYSMQLRSITTEKAKDESWIEDGVRYIASDPYGFDNGKEFRVYMPGSKTADLPEEFIQWVAMPRAWGSNIPETLPMTGIYNVAGQMGF